MPPPLLQTCTGRVARSRGQPAMNVSSIAEAIDAAKEKLAWIFDLDGVIYTGDDAVPGATATIEQLQEAGKRIMFLTNNSTRTRGEYVAKLGSMGMQVDEHDIFTSAWITAEWLTKRYPARDGSNLVYVIGENGIKTELRRKGFHVLDEDELDADDHLVEQTSHVIVGLDRAFTYHKLSLALDCLVRGNATFLATNDDAALPVGGGRIAPGAGAIVQAVATCARRQPDHGSPFGKPNPGVFEVIIEATGIQNDQMIMIGDRVETDVLAAKRAGITSILVLTGVTNQEDAIPESMQPDIVLRSMASLKNVVIGRP